MRMAYKILGLTLPKPIRTKLAQAGADFSDYFPVRTNMKPGHSFLKCSLGLLEDKVAESDSELRP